MIEPMNNVAMLIGYFVMVVGGLVVAAFLAACAYEYCIKHFKLFWRFAYFIFSRGWEITGDEMLHNMRKEAIKESTPLSPTEAP